MLGGTQAGVVDPVGWQILQHRELVGEKQPSPHKGLQSDEVFIARKRRQGLVGGIAVGGRPGGQKLPHRQAHLLPRLDKCQGTIADITDAMRPGQGGQMHRDPGEAAVGQAGKVAPIHATRFSVPILIHLSRHVARAQQAGLCVGDQQGRNALHQRPVTPFVFES